MTTNSEQKQRTSRWATASIDLGLFSSYHFLILLPTHHQFAFLFMQFPWILWGAPLAFCAVCFGVVGLNRVRTSSGRLTGWPIGIAGILLGCFSICFALFIAAPSFIEARRYSKRRICRSHIQCILDAIQHARKAGISNITSVSDLVPTFLTNEPHCPNAPRAGYVITCSNVVCPVAAKYPDHSIAADDGLFDENGPPIDVPDDFFDASSQDQAAVSQPLQMKLGENQVFDNASDNTSRLCRAQLRKINWTVQLYLTTSHTSSPRINVVFEVIGKELKCPLSHGAPYVMSNSIVYCPGYLMGVDGCERHSLAVTRQKPIASGQDSTPLVIIPDYGITGMCEISFAMTMTDVIDRLQEYDVDIDTQYDSICIPALGTMLVGFTTNRGYRDIYIQLSQLTNVEWRIVNSTPHRIGSSASGITIRNIIDVYGEPSMKGQCYDTNFLRRTVSAGTNSVWKVYSDIHEFIWYPSHGIYFGFVSNKIDRCVLPGAGIDRK